jgi:hypothetical protein
LPSFHITTFDETGFFHFFTLAVNHKEALLHLIENSSDYKNIVKDNVDFTIEIKKLKP